MKREELKDNWPLPNEYLIELGRISALYGQLENFVNLSIGKLGGYERVYDYRVGIMLAHSNFQQRIDILATLFEQSVSEYAHLKNYENVIKLIKRAQKGRNKFIHSGLGFNAETKTLELSALSARGTLSIKTENIYIKELKEVSAVIHEAMCSLNSIITQVEIKPIWERNA